MKHGRAMSCGTGEILILAFVLVVIFSASRMGALGNAIGKFVYSFKKASKGEDFVDVRKGPAARLPTKKADIEDAEIVDDSKR
ncbi:MAG: twin-arginine translocase TatA/TatE family subunit [Myxococcaceae bacterium]